MDIVSFINNLLSLNAVNLFFKIFSVVFGLFYVVYALIFFRQTQIMIKTLNGKNYVVILFVSTIQLLISIFIFLFAIVL